jgi:acetone carboxylase gamma subunit
MKVNVTEYLRIDLDRELWECRQCGHGIGPARDNYKKGLKLYKRNPQEIHRPILNPSLYRYTFAPDPAICSIVECYCPNCGTLIEAEYLPPGMMPAHDLEFDIDALKAYLQAQGEVDTSPKATLAEKPRGCGHEH